jgi:O-antigen/teichoic acid export membrane protein
MALGRPGLVTSLQVIGLLMTIPLMLVLIPRFGVEGAAGALLISTSVRLAFVLVSFQRVLKVECPRIVARRADVVTMFASLKALRQSQSSAA